jgi:hypothetical protein
MQNRLTITTLQTEANKHGLDVAKSKGYYTLVYLDSLLSVFNKSASSLALTQEWLNDYILLKSYDIDLTQPYDQDTIQTVLDGVCPDEWEAIAPEADKIRWTSDLYRVDRLPIILKVAEQWKAGNYADILPGQLEICVRHCAGLFNTFNDYLTKQNLNDVTQLDPLLKEFFPATWELWQNDKTLYSKVFGETDNDRIVFFNLLGCTIYLKSLMGESKCH